MVNVFQQALDALAADDLPRAREMFRRTLTAAHNNQALILEELGEPGAEEHYRAALKADPHSVAAAFGLAISLLRAGRYAEAWPLYESRRQTPHIRLPAMPDSRPEWRGENLAGKRILVVGEQGLGDQIMFARFLEPLRAMGADARLVCDGSLVRLLGGDTTLRLSEFDCWILLQSLPWRMGTTLETLPPPVSLPIAWRGGGGIGVVPTGNPLNRRDADRSLDAASVQRLLGLGRDLRQAATGARDFWETAEIVAGLDLVVTVDTSVAHLAASMGVPTAVLLPARAPDWRWMRERTDCRWYPTATLYRQQTAGDWASVIDRVVTELI